MDDLLWMGILFIFMSMVACFGIVAYVWLTPILPYVRAKLDGKDLLIVFERNGKIRLVPAKYGNSVYTVTKPPWTFLQVEPSNYRLGDVQAVPVLDNWGVIADPKMFGAIQDLEKIGITNYEEMRQQLIREQYELDLSVEEGREPRAELIKLTGNRVISQAFQIINFEKIYNYVGANTPVSVRAHIDEEIARFVEEKQLAGVLPGKSNSFPIIMVVIVIGLIAVGAVAAKMMGVF